MYHQNDTKNKILAAALEMINSTGYGSLSISELARTAKISKQNLYYHYPSMDEILLTLAEKWSQTGQQCTIEALARSQERGVYKILDIAVGMFDWMKKDSELSKLGLVLFQSGPYINKLDIFMEKSRIIARKRIRDLLEQEQSIRELPKSEIDRIIISIHSLMYGCFLYVVAMNDFRNLNLHQQNCTDAIRRLIGSYLK